MLNKHRSLAVAAQHAVKRRSRDRVGAVVCRVIIIEEISDALH
jgi:hypothetical protein